MLFELRDVFLAGSVSGMSGSGSGAAVVRPRLAGVSLKIADGFTAVLGYSGAGKSSLLSVLAGYEEPTSGSIERGVPLQGGALPCFWVPQSCGLWAHLSVQRHLELVGAGNADEILHVFDLWERRAALPGELSQGERSRLSVVRALASGARVLLMDEPLAHVDPVRKPRYWRELERLVRASGASLIFSTHEPAVVLRTAERVVCLRDGGVWHESLVEELYERAPCRELGELLGPVNWLDGALAKALGLELADGSGAGVGGGCGVCVRPERLRLVRVTESGERVGGSESGRAVVGGVVQVRNSQVIGGLAETVVDVSLCGSGSGSGTAAGECRLLHGLDWGAVGEGIGSGGGWGLSAGEWVRVEYCPVEVSGVCR